MSESGSTAGVADRLGLKAAGALGGIALRNPKLGARLTVGVETVFDTDLASDVMAHMRTTDPAAADDFGSAVVRAGSRNVELAKQYVRRQFKLGDFRPAVELREVTKGTRAFRRLADLAQSNLDLLTRGYPLPPRAATSDAVMNSRRVLYFLHNALPFDSGGYATRAQGIMQGVKREGFDIAAVSRLGYPSDRGKKLDGVDIRRRYRVDGIDYFNFNDDARGLGRDPLTTYMAQNIAALTPLARAQNASILHGASNFVNGVAANAIARRLGICSVYEVRGLWEITRRSREPAYVDTDAYRQYVRMEAEACREADWVLTITGALKDELVARGVPAERITIAPNGVNSERFQPRLKNIDLMRRLGIADDELVIGYIGSIVDYEGLDLLLTALAEIKAREDDLKWRCIIVGDGAVHGALKAQADRLGLNDRVIFTGRVPHHEVEDYYSIVDIVPFPRKGLLVCEMVSALKPFEAMAMGKCILASNVAAMQEFIHDGVNGFLFQKDDHGSLSRALTDMMRQPDLVREVGQSARKWVVRERDWSQISKRIAGVYEHVLEARGADFSRRQAS